MKFRIESLEQFALNNDQSDPQKPPCPDASWDEQRQYWTVQLAESSALQQLAAWSKIGNPVIQFEPSADGEISGIIQLIDCCPDHLYDTLSYRP